MKGLALNSSTADIKEGNEYISSRIERLLFVSEGEVLGYPDWGSKIQSILHDELDEITGDDLNNEINFLIGTREEGISLESSEISIVDMGDNLDGMIATIEISEDSEEEVQTIQFFKVMEF